MSLSREKLDISDKIDEVSSKIHLLTQARQILKRGMDSIDEEGESMLEGNTMLAQEVQKIMRGEGDYGRI